MISGREKVKAALNGSPLLSPPKGEILITKELIRRFDQPDLPSLLAFLQSDLVTFNTKDFPAKNHWQQWARTDHFVFGLLDGPFNLLAEKTEWMTLLRMVMKNPAQVRQEMQALLAENVTAAQTALDGGCDGIIIGDDLAGSHGLLASPSFFREYYFPLLAEVLQGWQGVPVLFHSCGKVMELIPDLKSAGFCGLQGLQPSAGFKPAALLAENDSWVFWGNFEFEGNGVLKPAAEMTGEIVTLLDEWASWPHYIFGSSGGLFAGLDPDAIKAAYDAVHSYKKSIPRG